MAALATRTRPCAATSIKWAAHRTGREVSWPSTEPVVMRAMHPAILLLRPQAD